MITVEYLLAFYSKSGQCSTIKAFNSLIASNAGLTTLKNHIKYNDSDYIYNINIIETTDKECTVFHVTFQNDKLSVDYINLLRIFKKTVSPLIQENNVFTIWDGVSFELSKEIYPLIYEIENLMRKFISKFMLIKLGIGWYKSSVPSNVKQSIRKEKNSQNHEILYELDFIQLSHFLFEKYSIKEQSKIQDILQDILDNGLNEEKRDEIQNYILKNNWDRYFATLINYDSEQLKKEWTSLYEIRCKVAHNNSITSEDVKNTKELTSKLIKIINKAFNSISQIVIPEGEKESVSFQKIALTHPFSKEFSRHYEAFNSTASRDSLLYKHFIDNIAKNSQYYLEEIESKSELLKEFLLNEINSSGFKHLNDFSSKLSTMFYENIDSNSLRPFSSLTNPDYPIKDVQEDIQE